MIQDYTYKFRLYPSKDQEILLSKHFGCTRWVYNYFLNERTQYYLNNKEKDLKKKSLNYFDNCKELTKIKNNTETEWLNECNSQSLQHSLKHLDSAFNRFFKKLGKYPNFKSRKNKQSFRIPQCIKVENNKIFIRKFKEGIKINLHRPIEGEIQNATIIKNKSGQYYASIGVKRNIEHKYKNDKAVGIDLGISTLAACSDGQTFENIKPLKNLEKRIKLKNKELSRTKKGSKGREKARRKLAKLHLKVSNIRNDHLHKISTKLVSENQTICLEDLNVKGMVKNHKLAKAINDCSWSELVRQIEYKSKWYGREVIKIDRFFPSSKTCECCGWINKELVLGVKEWVCGGCGILNNRDLNASKMILKQGLNLKNIKEKQLTTRTVEIANCLDVRPSKIGQSIGLETQQSLFVGCVVHDDLRKALNK